VVAAQLASSARASCEGGAGPGAADVELPAGELAEIRAAAASIQVQGDGDGDGD
jgi:hypothetical protein